MKDLKRKVYNEALFKYGFLTLLFLLRKHEQEENYEECEIILSVLDKANLEYDLGIPTSCNREAIEYYKEQMANMGLLGAIALKSIPVYAFTIEQEINIAFCE